MRLLVKQTQWGLLFFAAIVAVGFGVGTPITAHAATATWTANPASNDTVGWRGVAWSPELGIFVSVSGGADGIMTSSDGITWTTRTTPATTQIWRGIAWSPELNLFAAVGNNAGSSVIMTSPDGSNWTLRTAPSTSTYMGLTWSPEQGKFVATLSPVTGSISSPDGITWTAAPVMTMPSASRNVIWAVADSQYVATRSSASLVYTSPDGVTWTQRTATLSSTDVAYSPTLDKYAAVGASGIMTSSDAITWTTQTSPVTNLRAITWSPENSEFAAVGLGGIVTSPDGVTWTAAPSPAANTWDAIDWSSQLSRYVATSTDGVNRTMVGIVPTVPTAPLNLAGALEGQQPKLTWTPPIFDGNVTITGYRIERSVNGGPFTELVTDTGSTSTTYIDVTIDPDTTYRYRVYALNAEGQSVASNEVSVETGPVPVVADPQNTLANTGSNQTNTGIAAFGIVLLGFAVIRLLKLRA